MDDTRASGAPVPPAPRSGTSRPARWPLWAGAAIVLIVIAAWLFVPWRESPPKVSPRDEAAEAAPSREQPPAPQEETAQEPPVELPPLAQSDSLVRELAVQLSSSAVFSSWLSNNDLLRRFVASVVNVDEGATPRAHLQFLMPSRGFQVVERHDRFLMDRRNYERFDRIAEVFASVDAQAAARAYRTVKPLIAGAYRELGYPDRDFDAALTGAVGRLIATPVIEGDIELVPRVRTYAFADPGLEALSPAQKQLLRLGPDNMRKVQAKLRELWDALELGNQGHSAFSSNTPATGRLL